MVFQNSSEEDKKFYTYINKGVCDNIPYIFSKIVEWGCKKPADETLKNFMDREKRIKKKQLKKLFYGPDLQKLDSKDCGDFDVTFLFKLLPFICEGIQEYDANTWSESEEKLEYYLLKLRDIRNCVSHENNGASKSDEVVSLSFKAFEVAGKKYSIAHEEIVQEMKRFMEEISKILREFRENEYVTDWENRQFLLQDGRKTLSAKLTPSKNDFVPLQLSSGGNKFKSTQLLERISSETSKVFVIRGNDGNGKSALLTDLNEKVLRGISPPGNDAFDIPIIIRSHDTLHGNLANFLQELFTRRNTLDQVYLDASRPQSGEDIIRALENMKPLFLVDEFDDFDSDFLREVISLIKRIKTAKCIITSRLPFRIKLCFFLDKFDIIPNMIEISKISKREDQIQFVKESVNGGEKASETYARLDLNLQTPSQLSLFAHLYENDAEKVESWSNSIPIMAEIVRDNKNEITKHLNEKNVKNSKTIADQISSEVKIISFFCFLRDIKIIKGGLCEALEQNVYNKIKSIGVPIEVNNILSRFFTCDTESSSSLYEFYNDHHLQVLAVMHLMQELSKGKRSILEIIEFSMKKFGRIHAQDINCSDYDDEHQKEMYVHFRAVY